MGFLRNPIVDGVSAVFIFYLIGAVFNGAKTHGSSWKEPTEGLRFVPILSSDRACKL
jgi:hypothetical protein